LKLSSSNIEVTKSSHLSLISIEEAEDTENLAVSRVE
jgi:hypothetical protein